MPLPRALQTIWTKEEQEWIAKIDTTTEELLDMCLVETPAIGEKRSLVGPNLEYLLRVDTSDRYILNKNHYFFPGMHVSDLTICTSKTNVTDTIGLTMEYNIITAIQFEIEDDDYNEMALSGNRKLLRFHGDQTFN